MNIITGRVKKKHVLINKLFTDIFNSNMFTQQISGIVLKYIQSAECYPTHLALYNIWTSKIGQ